MKTTTCTPAHFETLAVAHLVTMVQIVCTPFDVSPIEDTPELGPEWTIPCKGVKKLLVA